MSWLSYLSAKYHSYTRSGIQGELGEVFEAQYELTLTEEVEIRYRTETSTTRGRQRDERGSPL